MLYDDKGYQLNNNKKNKLNCHGLNDNCFHHNHYRRCAPICNAPYCTLRAFYASLLLICFSRNDGVANTSVHYVCMDCLVLYFLFCDGIYFAVWCCPSHRDLEVGRRLKRRFVRCCVPDGYLVIVVIMLLSQRTMLNRISCAEYRSCDGGWLCLSLPAYTVTVDIVLIHTWLL